MADIRTAPIMDEFNRPSEDPLDGGGRWVQSFSNVRAMTVWYPGDSGNGQAARPYVTPSGVTAYSHWTAKGFDGDCEIYGERNEFAGLLGHNNRFTMIQGADGGLSSSQWNGYVVLVHRQSSGMGVWQYRVTNGGTTQLSSVVNGTANSRYCIFRRSGNLIETWMTNDTNNWINMGSVSDTTYMTDMWLGMGEGANFGSDTTQEGWDNVGGGRARRQPQIYRWIKN